MRAGLSMPSEITSFRSIESIIQKRTARINRAPFYLPGISKKVLTSSLRSMETDGLIDRTVYDEIPPRVEYSLSPLGETMRPIISAMHDWGIFYKQHIDR